MQRKPRSLVRNRLPAVADYQQEADINTESRHYTACALCELNEHCEDQASNLEDRLTFQLSMAHGPNGNSTDQIPQSTGDANHERDHPADVIGTNRPRQA